MKKIYQIVLLLVAGIAALGSCTNIDSLSDENQVAALDVVSYSPKTITLGSTKLEPVRDTFYLEIAFGKYEFPLRFHAQLKIDAGIDRVMGIDFNEEQCLESIDDVITFYVMARSGLTRTYYIKAKEVPLDENNYIERELKFKDLTRRVAPEGRISTKGDTLKIYSLSESFPITVTPLFSIADDAKFRNFENGKTALTFNNSSTIHKLKVVSGSGAERIWNVRMVNAPILSGADGTSNEAQRAGTDINPREFNAVLEGAEAARYKVYESSVNNTDETITLTISEESKARSAKVDFEKAAIHITFSSFEGVCLMGMVNDTVMTFSGYDEVKEFYMVDLDNATSRHWKIKLSESTESSADVLGFSYTYVGAKIPTTRKNIGTTWKPKYEYGYEPSIDLDPAKVEVYPQTGEIYITSTKIRTEFSAIGDNKKADKLWKLTVTPAIRLSKGATSDMPATFEWVSNYEPLSIIPYRPERENDCWKYGKEFTVTAEDGTQKKWTLKIRDTEPTFNTACELISFEAGKIIPDFTKLDEKTPIIRNDETNEIIIKLADDEGCYPMSIFPDIKYSDYASLSANYPMRFESASSTQSLTITAQDGKATSVWTVKLLPPAKAEGADIVTFDATGYRSKIDKEKKQITIYLEGTPPQSIGYQMAISDKATTSVPVRGTLNFSSVWESKNITVTSQSGSSNLWLVKLDYRPQLDNANLDRWDGNEPQPSRYWASANNSFATMTTVIPGVTGQAANLESKKAPIVNTFAAGSLFTGWFDKANAASLGLTDPVKLTHFGIPWQTPTRILGVKADVIYRPGDGAGSDNASVQLYLLKYDGSGQIVFHGNKPQTGKPHSDNNATPVASGYALLGTQAGTANNTTITVLPDPDKGEWTRIFIPFNYTGTEVPRYTHLSICFSSSYKGDSFQGAVGSTLKVDNVEIVYETEE